MKMYQPVRECDLHRINNGEEVLDAIPVIMRISGRLLQMDFCEADLDSLTLREGLAEIEMHGRVPDHEVVVAPEGFRSMPVKGTVLPRKAHETFCPIPGCPRAEGGSEPPLEGPVGDYLSRGVKHHMRNTANSEQKELDRAMEQWEAERADARSRRKAPPRRPEIPTPHLDAYNHYQTHGVWFEWGSTPPEEDSGNAAS